MSGNICYNHLGHGYFLEDGIEHGNTIEGNLGILARTPVSGEQVLASDMRPATFWITNPANTYNGNVAAGSMGVGFWIALPLHPNRAVDDGRRVAASHAVHAIHEQQVALEPLDGDEHR